MVCSSNWCDHAPAYSTPDARRSSGPLFCLPLLLLCSPVRAPSATLLPAAGILILVGLYEQKRSGEGSIGEKPEVTGNVEVRGSDSGYDAVVNALGRRDVRADGNAVLQGGTNRGSGVAYLQANGSGEGDDLDFNVSRALTGANVRLLGGGDFYYTEIEQGASITSVQQTLYSFFPNNPAFNATRTHADPATSTRRCSSGPSI
jgi:hypothetical protein